MVKAKKKTVKKSVIKKSAAHTMQIDEWMWKWAQENDPQQRTNAAPYLKSLLSRLISEENARTGEMQERLDDTEFVPSEDAMEVGQLLEDDGLKVVRAPRRKPVKAHKHGPCIITELKCAVEGNFEPPDRIGKTVMFARFYRESTDSEYDLPIDPKYAGILREIEQGNKVR